jgi:hypothetical protein
MSFYFPPRSTPPFPFIMVIINVKPVDILGGSLFGTLLAASSHQEIQPDMLHSSGASGMLQRLQRTAPWCSRASGRGDMLWNMSGFPDTVSSSLKDGYDSGGLTYLADASVSSLSRPRYFHAFPNDGRLLKLTVRLSIFP